MKLTIKTATLIIAIACNAAVSADIKQSSDVIEATLYNFKNVLKTENARKPEQNDVVASRLSLDKIESKTSNYRPVTGSFRNKTATSEVNHYQLDVIDIYIENDTAYLSALWTITVIADDGNVRIQDGYLNSVLIRRQDGSWAVRTQDLS